MFETIQGFHMNQEGATLLLRGCLKLGLSLNRMIFSRKQPVYNIICCYKIIFGGFKNDIFDPQLYLREFRLRAVLVFPLEFVKCRTAERHRDSQHLHLHLQWLPTRSYNGHSVGGRSGLIYMVSFVLNSSVLLMSSTAGGSLFHSRWCGARSCFCIHHSYSELWGMGWDPLVLRSGLWVT